MTTGFSLFLGAIAGFIGHLVGKGDGLGLMSVVLVAVGVFAGWIVAQMLGA